MIPETPADRERTRRERTRSGRRTQILFLALFALLFAAAALAPLVATTRGALVALWWALALVAVAALAVQLLAAWRLRALRLEEARDGKPTPAPRRPVDFDRAWREGRL